MLEYTQAGQMMFPTMAHQLTPQWSFSSVTPDIWLAIYKKKQLAKLALQYCPGKSPVGARSSSTRGWAVVQRRSRVSAHPWCEVSRYARGTGSTCFVRASTSHSEGGESCIVLESRRTRSLIAKLQQRSSLAAGEFCAASEERYERSYRRMCVKLWCRVSWHLERIRTIALMYLSSATYFQFTVHEFSMVGGYTEHLQNFQNRWMGACPGQYDILYNTYAADKCLC